MTVPTSPRFIFADRLRQESERVLEDVVFQRSPVQSQLLRFLVDATLREGPAPSQYEIAVDALGKDPDFDLANDSYPRVQISRLRSNLDNYYSRNRPFDGVRLKIRQGRYQLDLVRAGDGRSDDRIATVTTALPEQLSGSSANAGDTSNASSPERAPGHSHFDLVDPEMDDDIAMLTPRGQQWREKAKNRLSLVVALAAITFFLFAALLYNAVAPWWKDDRSPAPLVASGDVPSIGFEIDTKGMVGDGGAFGDEIQIALRKAEIAVGDSFIARVMREGRDEAPDYTLTLDFGQASGSKFEAFMTLAGADGKTLFTDRLRFDPENRTAFDEELDAALIEVVSPAGAISEEQFEKWGRDPKTDYQCFVTIENLRADYGRVGSMVDQCIADHPDSTYTPFFLARRAFMHYQTLHLAGEPKTMSGKGWRDLTAALEMDRFNPFANFVAAKVYLANGDCRGARVHMRSAFDRSASYPALIAALGAEANSCPELFETEEFSSLQLQAIVEHTPASEPLHHLYLLIATASSGDRENAATLAKRARVQGEEGKEERTIALLERAIVDSDFARANADRLRKDVGLFIWGDAAVEQLVENLTQT
ncbi:MAG: hypothetical protein WA936_03840 [Erythrobacter sp.]|uniref:hypothetical protein n=1 Tax=Erythrobacter sp. TaxID=1042 RepID=UPI003C779501